MIQQTITASERRYISMLRTIVIGVILVTPFYGLLSTWIGTTVGPLWLWKSLLDIIIAVLALIFFVWVLQHRASRQRLFAQPIIIAMVSFSIVALLVTAIMHPPSAQLAAGLAFGLRYIFLFCIVYGTTALIGIGREWWAKTVQIIFWITITVVILGVIQVTIMPADFLTHFGYGPETIAPVMTIDQNDAARRAFATMRGPNDFGAVMIIALGIACMAKLRRHQRVILAAASLIGMFISGSRSALLGGFVVIVAAVVMRAGVKTLRRPLAIGIIAGSFVLACVVLYAATTIPALRLIVFHSSPTDTHLTEGSTDKHWEQTWLGLERVALQPLGCGLGCAGPASFYGAQPQISENYYVQVAEETGIVGVAIWIVMMMLVMNELRTYKRRDRAAAMLFVSGLGISVVGFWLHVWADITLSLVWWGLVAVVLGNAIAKSTQKGYDTT